MRVWSPASWQHFPCLHYPDYPSSFALAQVVTSLQALPPLVTSGEIIRLRAQLAEAMAGRVFLLQGGDCAESFTECQEQIIKNKIQLLNRLAVQIAAKQHCPVVQVARMAGQYAKPRSALMESRAGEHLPSYQGDMINAQGFTKKERTPNPDLMAQAYWHAATTLAVIRQQDHALYTSHEALLLPYEQALTRFEAGAWYNLSTHFPWIGYRTHQIAGAHIEYVRGIANPIAIKVGSDTTPAVLQQLVHVLNPQQLPGRLVIMTRLGAQQTATLLPPLITAVLQTRCPVLWSCDPMHGNTCLTASGMKTRYIEDILSELMQTMMIHERLQSRLGGVHLEMTSEPVAECMGGQCHFQETDLKRAYTSLVDPRLNAAQAKEVIQQSHLGIGEQDARRDKKSQSLYHTHSALSAW